MEMNNKSIIEFDKMYETPTEIRWKTSTEYPNGVSQFQGKLYKQE